MHLKSIELYGFKSFGDRTKIELDNNITCIVGPNGSGKSNITDAIKWALGEQSYTSLRGSKMSDVIFSGTNTRRALGFAEVILVFDNSSKFLEIDYSEVEIKRKLFKNGDSEYYINNNPCRLKDIRQLFMDTGIGRDGYSIISQGKIDEILTSKPIERRMIFEEAAGISKYKFQKNEVERKLERTNENLIRISDLLVEIRNNRDLLKKEAKTAIKYKDLYEEIKNAEIAKSYEEIVNYINQDSLNRSKLLELNKKKNNISNFISEFDETGRELKLNLENVEMEITTLQGENIENIRREKDLSNNININNEKIDAKISEVKELITRINQIEENVENSRKSLNEVLAELEKKEILKDKIKSEKTDFEKKIIEIDSTINKQELEISNLDSRLEDLEDTKSRIKIRKETLESLNEERFNNLKLLDEQKQRLTTNSIEIDQSMKKLDVDASSISNKFSEFQKETLSSSEYMKKLNSELIELQNTKTEIINLYNIKSVRANTLSNMEEVYEGYNKSIKDFFKKIKEDKKIFDGLNDTVANLIEVEAKFEKAITTSLGGNMQNLVVDNFDDAKSIIAYLKRHRLGRITFLPIDCIDGYFRKEKIDGIGFIGYAYNLISFNDKYKGVFAHLLGNVLVVDNLDNAHNLSQNLGNKFRIVTLDGDIINTSGSVSGGHLNISGGIFNRKNELIKLRKEIDIHTRDLKQKEEEISKKLDEIQLTEMKINKISNSLKKLKVDIEKINSKKLELKFSEENNQKIKIQYDEEYYKNKTQIKDTKEILITLENKLLDLNIEEKDLKSSLGKYNDLYQSLYKDRENMKLSLSKVSLEIDNIDSEIGYIQKDLRRIEDSIHSYEGDINTLSKRITRINDEKDVLKSKNDDFKILLNKILVHNENYENESGILTKKRKALMNELNSINENLNNCKNNLLEYEKEIYFITNNLELSREKYLSLISEIQNNYYYTIEAMLIRVPEFKARISKNKIRIMKDEISKLGTVNLNSIKSYREIEERYDFTKKQYKDLIESEESLKIMLKDIEKTMKEKFNESFIEINSNFNRIFKFLFNGGSAELSLDKHDSFEDAGVDIVAKLPGKKKQLLDALSGGEKTLTTVALLFALLETRPAPFCLLDEIDAALDESNIKRFLSYLINLKHIQFAIITHRKTTMTVADYIYGITMEEPGISKVISLKFGGRKENVQVV